MSQSQGCGALTGVAAKVIPPGSTPNSAHFLSTGAVNKRQRLVGAKNKSSEAVQEVSSPDYKEEGRRKARSDDRSHLDSETKRAERRSREIANPEARIASAATRAPAKRAHKQKTKGSRREKFSFSSPVEQSVSDMHHRMLGAEDALKEQKELVQELTEENVKLREEAGETKEELEENSVSFVNVDTQKIPEPLPPMPAPADTAEGFNKHIVRFSWNEASNISAIIFIMIYGLMYPWFLSYFNVGYTSGYLVLMATTALLRYWGSLLPQTHVVYPVRKLQDHENDERPDAHSLVDIKHKCDYYEWVHEKSPKISNDILEVRNSILSWSLRMIDGILETRDVYGQTVYIIEHVRDLLLSQRQQMLIGWFLRITIFFSPPLFMRALHTLAYAAVKYVFFSKHILYEDWTYSELAVSIVIYISTLLAVKYYFLFSHKIHSISRQTMFVSNEVVKQLSVFRNTDPCAQSADVAERIRYSARSICTVNFDKNELLYGRNIVDDSVQIATHIYLAKMQANEGFRIAL